MAEEDGRIEYGSRAWWRWERRARGFVTWAKRLESPGYHRTPKAKRPKCGAKCRDGHACQARPVWDFGQNAPLNGRCRLHGGLSTGPRSRGKPREEDPAGSTRQDASQAQAVAGLWTRSEEEGVALLEQVIARVDSANERVMLRAAELLGDLVFGKA